MIVSLSRRRHHDVSWASAVTGAASVTALRLKRAPTQGLFDVAPDLAFACLDANIVEPVNNRHDRLQRLSSLIVLPVSTFYDVSQHQIDMISAVFSLPLCRAL